MTMMTTSSPSLSPSPTLRAANLQGIILNTKTVTESDFRLPEFRDAKPEDYEFDGTGQVVRKDRWETAVRRIVYILEDADYSCESISSRSFKIQDVVDFIEGLAKMGVHAYNRKYLADGQQGVDNWEGDIDAEIALNALNATELVEPYPLHSGQ